MSAEAAVEAKGLTRRYGKRLAISELSVTVPAGSVYGFLGPNGAGKTTAMRCILGLIHLDAGQVAIFGETHPVRRRRHVGALVETPRFHEWLSGRANLEIAAAYADADAKAEVDRVLARVGLQDRAQDKVQGYSLGMKQRLGIARALLGAPRLLILDEPSNGLDPQGMKQMRDLLRSLARDDGLTIVISSHMLYEIEAVADHVGVIRDGRRVAEGAVSELLASGGQDLVEVVSPKPDALDFAVASLEGVEALPDPGERGGRLLRLGSLTPEALNAALVGAGVPVSELIARGESLEDLFLRLTGAGEIR
ncbi:MAG: ABC transporter ATP-binding protein [Alphaproteobacteria bacterium]|nr:ABC transporter ATP-binding protein [Alphaproteobacteria bacterium]MCB9792142.1 ABC transporter ATP-binding protein [Alphaproteobacteria bacterium]